MDLDDFATRMENAMNENTQRLENDMRYEMSKQKYGFDSSSGPSLVPLVVIVAVLGVLYLTFIVVPFSIIAFAIMIGQEVMTGGSSLLEIINEIFPPEIISFFQAIPKEVWTVAIIVFVLFSLAVFVGIIALIVVIKNKRKKKKLQQQQYNAYYQNDQNYK